MLNRLLVGIIMFSTTPEAHAVGFYRQIKELQCQVGYEVQGSWVYAKPLSKHFYDETPQEFIGTFDAGGNAYRWRVQINRTAAHAEILQAGTSKVVAMAQTSQSGEMALDLMTLSTSSDFSQIRVNCTKNY